MSKWTILYFKMEILLFMNGDSVFQFLNFTGILESKTNLTLYSQTNCKKFRSY